MTISIIARRRIIALIFLKNSSPKSMCFCHRFCKLLSRWNRIRQHYSKKWDKITRNITNYFKEGGSII